MASFSDNIVFEVATCCNCGMPFAMTAAFQKKRLNDRQQFYCPAGHGQHYTGPTEAQKLKDELERKRVELERRGEMLLAAELRAERGEANLAQVTRAHKKMRERVMNGVCPCCNRSFQNLREHMKTEHADFGSVRTLFALRQAFGMTQAAVAREAGVDATYVSMYERDKHCPGYAKRALDNWLDAHGAGPSAEPATLPAE